jgi:hypothetical protein
MSRTCFAALALIGLAACGGGKPSATAHTKSAAAAHRATTRATTTKAKATRKTAARPDTSGRNPLTNH